MPQIDHPVALWYVETDAKNWTSPKFFLAILPTHELVFFTKFHNNWIKIVDFLIKGHFWSSPH